jgi:hypothetical protein
MLEPEFVRAFIKEVAAIDIMAEPRSDEGQWVRRVRGSLAAAAIHMGARPDRTHRMAHCDFMPLSEATDETGRRIAGLRSHTLRTLGNVPELRKRIDALAFAWADFRRELGAKAETDGVWTEVEKGLARRRERVGEQEREMAALVPDDFDEVAALRIDP